MSAPKPDPSAPSAPDGYEIFVHEPGTIYEYDLKCRLKTDGPDGWYDIEKGSDFDKWDIEDSYFARQITPTPPPTLPEVRAEGASGISLIAAERERQVSQEGWTEAHDQLATSLAEARKALGEAEKRAAVWMSMVHGLPSEISARYSEALKAFEAKHPAATDGARGGDTVNENPNITI